LLTSEKDAIEGCKQGAKKCTRRTPGGKRKTGVGVIGVSGANWGQFGYIKLLFGIALSLARAKGVLGKAGRDSSLVGLQNLSPGNW